MQVAVQCPLCATSGNVDIPTTLVENNPRGLVSINIPAELICKHNFQLFLDRNWSVRGYQKIDFEVWSSTANHGAELIPVVTEFKCKLCEKTIRFSPTDKSSYLSKRDHEQYFGMRLTTYQVAHVAGDEIHVNTVIIDEQSAFQGYVGGYPVPLSEFLINGAMPAKKSLFSVIPETEPVIATHKFLEVLFLLNLETLQVYDVVCPPSLNIKEVARITREKCHEIEKIHVNLNDSTKINVADKSFRVWIVGKIALAAAFTSEEFSARFDPIAKHLLCQSFDWLIVRTDPVRIALKFLERSRGSSNEVSTFIRLVADDRLFSKIHVKFPENIHRILPRLRQEFGIAEKDLEPILLGQKSLSEQFGAGLVFQAPELLEVVDFIERRKLLA